MDFLTHLFHSFIPHRENDYRPYFLRVGSVLATALIIVVLFASASYVERVVLLRTNMAAVISAVLVDLTNGDREGNQLAMLSVNPTLVAAAQLKADDMAAKSYFAHTSPDGTTPWDWFKKSGYKFSYAGENLAVYFSDSVDVERAWMNSPGHRANILNARFSEIGIAIAEGVYQGLPTVFVVQMFGTPAQEAALTPVPATAADIQKQEEAVALVDIVSPPEPKAVAHVEGASTADDELQVITRDDTFIAVKNALPAQVPAPSSAYSSYWQRLFTSPKTTLGYLYTFLGLLIFIAMAFLIGIELKHQRPKNVFSAVLLIVLMAGLLSLGSVHILAVPA